MYACYHDSPIHVTWPLTVALNWVNTMSLTGLLVTVIFCSAGFITRPAFASLFVITGLNKNGKIIEGLNEKWRNGKKVKSKLGWSNTNSRLKQMREIYSSAYKLYCEVVNKWGNEWIETNGWMDEHANKYQNSKLFN